jgi:hypothetical protein
VIEAFAWSCAALAAGGLVLQVLNLGEFAELLPGKGRAGSVVACVAMRNEEANAGDCIESLLSQPEIARVIVIEDGSDDTTGAILGRMAREQERLRVIRIDGSESRSPKAAALAAAAARAADVSHEYLLFTDADVRLRSGAVGGAIEAARRGKLGAITAWPRTEATTVWDLLFAPLVILLLMQALPMRSARGTDPRFAAGNGQMFLVERVAYERCGGHAPISTPVEDVALARALKRSGFKVGLAGAGGVASTRGYGSLRANVLGYGRSLYYGAGIWGCVAFGSWQFCAFVAPWLLLPFAGAAAATGAACSLLARGLLTARTHEPGHAALLAPFGGICGVLGACAAIWLGRRGRFAWRGRPLAAHDA